MKNLLKNVIRSFKNNKISLIGLIFLLFFGLGTFCVMSNTTANINNQYTSIAKQGNLHDFTASELYEIGNAAYHCTNRGFEYTIPSTGPATITEKQKLDVLTTKLYSEETTPTAAGTYSVVIPSSRLFEGDKQDVYVRTYKLQLNEEDSTGLYSKFAEAGSEYVNFEVSLSETVNHGAAPSAMMQAIYALRDDQQFTEQKALDLLALNPLHTDYNTFLKGISDRNELIYNIMTTRDTPLTLLLDSEKYNKEVQYKQFKSINVTATIDNVFYKVIQSNPTDTIDKMILFKDPNGVYGNQLFNSTDWAPYNSEMKFYSLKGTLVPAGADFEDFVVPETFEDLAANLKIIPLSTASDWLPDKKFIYSQLIHTRFKRMFAGDRSTEDDRVENLLTKLSAVGLSDLAYYQQLFDTKGETPTEIQTAYTDYIGYKDSWNENIIISMNGNVVVNWSVPTPLTCTMVNWTSHFSIVNPQHLRATNKHVLDSKWFNEFEPFREWCYSNKGYYPSGTISQSLAIEWFNSLSNKQFNFWWRPSSFTAIDSMKYTIYNKDGTVAKEIIVNRGTGAGQWNGLPDESVVSCGKYYQIVWGCGITPDFMYPVVDITRPTPNVKTECLTYVNDAGYKALKLAFFNSPVEEFLAAKFMPSVTTTRQNQIIDELNKFCSENMLFPKEIKAVYRANDTSNVLNSSAFRVSYIPNLVSVINLISIILCSFLGILALIICLIIIKRYVENNRVNIGIMRANGISKMRIALSLMPFAFVPALIGGIAAYLVGLFLQIPMLGLFKNYWTLPTPILSFDWISMLVCIFLPFILFGIVTIIATLLVLRTSSVELMKAGSEFKTNSFSRVVKKPFKYFGVLTRFRVALAFNSLSRLIVLALMSCLTMTSLVFAMTSFGKLNRSQAINSSQFDYSFNLQLTTPTTAGGNYNVEDWSLMLDDKNYAGLGYTNPQEYIYNVTWDTYQSGDPEENLTKWYSDMLVPSSLLSEYRNVLAKNGNLFFPTAADAIGQKQDLQYLMNKTCSKLTLDYVVGVGSLSSNPWEIALALMPANSRNMASDAYNTIVQKAGEHVEAADKVYEEEIAKGTSEEEAAKLAGKWFYLNYSALSGYWNEYKTFFKYDDVKKEFVKPYEMSLDTKSWATSFSAAYAKFLVTIYTDEELMKDEYRISYGIIPKNWTPTKNEPKEDEYYTYLTGKMKDISSKQRPTFDPNHEITIEGIKQDSKFIKLTDNNGNDLNKVLYQAKDDSDYNWVIVNAYAAHKYNLGVGSTFSITMSNMVDRFDRQMHPEEFTKPDAKSDTAKFKVLAISQGTNGEAFYCKQKQANQLLGLPDGESWNSIHKYMLWQTDITEPVQVIDLANSDTDKNNYPIYSVSSDTGTVSKTGQQARFNWKTPLGFNGIYTADKAGRPLTAGLSLYSYSGLYPGTSVFNSESMRDLLQYDRNLPLANFMTGINDPQFYKIYKQRVDGEISEDEYRSKGVDEFIRSLRKYYGDTTMVTSICGANDVEASDLIYKNLISTFNLAETSIMSVIIPITIIVVGIISNLIINDSKKMAAMLKALGYSDRKNALSILALFVPTIVLGLALAIPAAMGVTIGYQALVFSNANILVDVTRKWWYYLASVGGIGIVLVTTYVVGWVSLKRDRLVDAIKR